jgi:nitrogenase molybdenum-iron protein beta chain
MSAIIDRPRFGCPLGGALGMLRAVPRTVPIVHASTGCAYNIYVGMNSGAGYLGGGYCGATSTPSSNVVEKEIVFGGEERLREQIATTIEIMDGDLYVVLSGCMVEMIGDDAQMVADGFKSAQPPVIAVSTPGFKGNSSYGYDVVLEALCKEYVLPREKKKARKVNVFGLVPGSDVFYKGNLREIKRVLNLIGVEANTLVGEGETLADIKNSGDAALNIVLSDIYAPLAAAAYEQVHHIPFVRTALPIGYLQTERFLRQIGGYFQIDEKTIGTALQKEQEAYFDYFERIADSYNDIDFQRYALVVADANYGPAVTEFIADELGWLPHLTVITDELTARQQELLNKRFEHYASGVKPTVRYDPNTASVRRYLSDGWEKNRNHRYYDAFSPAVVFGSVFDRELAEELQAPLLAVSFPVTNRVVFNRGYAGPNGGLTLAEDAFGLLVAGR